MGKRRTVARHEGTSFRPFGDACIPERLPFGELCLRQGHAGGLAPDGDVIRDPLRRAHHSGRDAFFAPVGFLLLAPPFGPFGVGEVEPGPSALDPVGSTLDAVMALGAGGFRRDVHGGRVGRDEGSLKGVLVFVSYVLYKQGKGTARGAAAIAARASGRARVPALAKDHLPRSPGNALRAASPVPPASPARAAASGCSADQALSSSPPALPRSCLPCAAWSLLRDRLTRAPCGGGERPSVLRSAKSVWPRLCGRDWVTPYPLSETGCESDANAIRKRPGNSRLVRTAFVSPSHGVRAVPFGLLRGLPGFFGIGPVKGGQDALARWAMSMSSTVPRMRCCCCLGSPETSSKTRCSLGARPGFALDCSTPKS